MPVTQSVLLRLLQQGEGTGIEFKRKINHPAKIAKSISAFANTSGGYIIIGIDDDGFPYGIEDEKYPADRVLSISESYLNPTVNLSLDLVALNAKEILVVRIDQSQDRPHFVVDLETGSKSAYIRSGNQSVEATPVQIEMMKLSGSSETRIEMGEPERILFEFLNQYGVISLEKFSGLAGISIQAAAQKLGALISMGIIQTGNRQGTEVFFLK